MREVYEVINVKIVVEEGKVFMIYWKKVYMVTI